MKWISAKKAKPKTNYRIEIFVHGKCDCGTRTSVATWNERDNNWYPDCLCGVIEVSYWCYIPALPVTSKIKRFFNWLRRKK